MFNVNIPFLPILWTSLLCFCLSRPFFITSFYLSIYLSHTNNTQILSTVTALHKQRCINYSLFTPLSNLFAGKNLFIMGKPLLKCHIPGLQHNLKDPGGAGYSLYSAGLIYRPLPKGFWNFKKTSKTPEISPPQAGVRCTFPSQTPRKCSSGQLQWMISEGCESFQMGVATQMPVGSGGGILVERITMSKRWICLGLPQVMIDQ